MINWQASKDAAIAQQDDILQHIKSVRDAWDDIASDEISRVKKQNKMMYNRNEFYNNIRYGGSISSVERFAINPLIAVNNRVKVDLRDIQAYLKAIPATGNYNADSKKLFEQILQEKILNSSNEKSIKKQGDNLVDMGISAIRIRFNDRFDQKINSIVKDVIIENVTDIQNLYFDASCEADDINRSSSFCGYACKITGDDGRTTESLEHWQKIYKKTTYRLVKNAITGEISYQAENALNKKSPKTVITECIGIRYVKFIGNELVEWSSWFSKEFPYKIKIVGLQDYNEEEGQANNIYLTPYSDAAIDAVKLFNMALTQQGYNLSMTRGTSKFMYASEMIDGHEKSWRNRNNSESDLPYNILRDKDGNVIPLKPEPVQDAGTSPVISEIIMSYPQLINNIAGQSIEQDMAYNASGSAIGARELVRFKNSKIYVEAYLELLDDIGLSLKDFIAQICKAPGYITVNNYGEQSLRSYNIDTDPNSIPLSKMVDYFNLSVISGSSQESDQAKTSAALEKIYAMLSANPQAQQEAISKTLDIYVSSLDTPDSVNIASRLKTMVDSAVLSVKDGQQTEEEAYQNTIAQNNQQAQQQAAQAQQEQALQLQGAQAEIEEKQQNAIYKQKSGDAAIMNAESKQQDNASDLAKTKIKANAEIAKSFKTGDKQNG